ncbi:TSUP family transporter [Shewanella algae]|uniref:Probable membrane transporter protein n=1 Tax=Shewanella algae TaxID=38313 RepID=A0A5N5TQL4_9GAMM|nr:TSUP family transporter [Shewanella algae]MBO2553018.1 TSUP family transporter [Shewanella algae]MBO2569984.1 TSUP family transporter [Shewanella algae]MBO2595744.1 TSUP family transporter [Shewanella algae]MBO2603981.1 TSUP family transporter [Shewanella algae]MBO2616673.1 TSUP family transporter [Shewanella algae]
MAFELTLQLATVLFFVALVAGFIDSIAGGGGLLTIPALMWAGLPPAAALGTNKLQACGGSFFASLYFVRKGMVKLGEMKLAIGCAFVGASVGTVLVQLIDASVLELVLPFLILAIGCYFLFSKKITEDDRARVLAPGVFAFTAALGVGLYDGFFGPGTGSFFALAFVSLAGFGLAKATAHAKVLNFSTNIASLIFFALGGKVVWLLGLVMLAGQAAGATLGSRLVITKGSKIIKPLVVVMSLVMSLKLLADQYQWSL